MVGDLTAVRQPLLGVLPGRRLPIEVVAVELDDGRLRIIHAMPMRASYRRLHDGDEGEQ